MSRQHGWRSEPEDLWQDQRERERHQADDFLYVFLDGLRLKQSWVGNVRTFLRGSICRWGHSNENSVPSETFGRYEAMTRQIDGGMTHIDASRQLGIPLRTVQKWHSCGVFSERKERKFPSTVDEFDDYLGGATVKAAGASFNSGMRFKQLGGIESAEFARKLYIQKAYRTKSSGPIFDTGRSTHATNYRSRTMPPRCVSTPIRSSMGTSHLFGILWK